jgi:hypothetical protein
MTEAVQVALIAAVPPTIVGAAALARSMLNASKINEVHLSLNSRLSELLIAAHAQGRQEERDSNSVTVPGVPAPEKKP